MNNIIQNGMNNQLMTNFEMDETASRIKNIIDPYLKQINELQNIIQQKDFQISVLTEKLNSYKRNQINLMNNNMNNNMLNNMNKNNNMNNNMLNKMNMNNNMFNKMNMNLNMNNNMFNKMNMNMNMNMNNNMFNKMNMNMNMNNNMFNNMNMNNNMFNNMNMNNNMLNNMNMDNNMNMNFPQNLNNCNINNINSSIEDNNINYNYWNIIFDYKKIKYNEMCNPEERVKNAIKRWCNKYGIRQKNHMFLFNAKKLNGNLKICQSGLSNFSIIEVNEIYNKVQNNEESDEEEDEFIKNKIEINFKTTQGIVNSIEISSEESIGTLLVKYLIRIGQAELISQLNSGKICFLFNAKQLKFNDKTKIKDFFLGIQNPKVIVQDVNNLIGA